MPTCLHRERGGTGLCQQNTPRHHLGTVTHPRRTAREHRGWARSKGLTPGAFHTGVRGPGPASATLALPTTLALPSSLAAVAAARLSLPSCPRFGLRMGVKLLFRSDLRGGRLCQQPHPTELWGHQCVQPGPPGKRSLHTHQPPESPGVAGQDGLGAQRGGGPLLSRRPLGLRKLAAVDANCGKTRTPSPSPTRAIHSEFASSSRA